MLHRSAITALLLLLFAPFTVWSETIIDTDFSRGSFEQLGWKTDGPWDIFTYPGDKNNPGAVARMPAHQPDGLLAKSFDPIHNPKALSTSIDVGWGWGAPDHSQGTGFMLLDESGDGYAFLTQRANGNWAAQWARVSQFKIPKDKNWAAKPLDTTHPSIRDGGGMQHLTVTRDIDGNWSFSSNDWNKGAGGAIDFTDTTTTRFTKLVLVGGSNVDELAFNKVRMEATQGSDYPQNRVSVITPAYCSDVQHDVQIDFAAPGFSEVTAKCWKQGEGFGADSTVGRVTLDARSLGSIRFPADQYPHGPITIRLSGANEKTKDTCYLQLFNKGGIRWKRGIPADPPPGAAGMKLVYSDDFAKPLSIGDDPKETYYDHKPPNGAQDFSTIPFTSFDKPNTPFKSVEGYLRIRADSKAHSAGLISSLKRDGTGVTASAPCYFECRFIAPNAIGSWPAFWLLTIDQPNAKGVDELDIIEAYGGEGPREPNAGDSYMITPHAWNQGSEGKALEDAAFKTLKNPCHMNAFGIPSTWFETFHTYGCKITETETVYYCDDIEVGRHPTLPLNKKAPFYFLVNLATGGGWPVDLSRYDGRVDMYIDYLRVYSGADSQ